MQKNEGATDRSIRILVGLGLLSWVVLGNGAIRYVGLFGLIPLITGVIGYCPLYTMLGMKTCAKCKK